MSKDDSLDLSILKARLTEYDPETSRCKIEREETINFAPPEVLPDDPMWASYTVTHTIRCCRPEGHAGACRISQEALGWPGFEILRYLIDRIETAESRLAEKNQPEIGTFDDFISWLEHESNAWASAPVWGSIYRGIAEEAKRRRVTLRSGEEV